MVERSTEPPKWMEDLAGEVEEARLQKLGALEKMTEPQDSDRAICQGLESEAQRSPTTSKQWLRRSRLVARDFAVDKRDDVHAPASGGQALRLLPLYLMQKSEEQIGGPQVVLGSLDVKDAFLQMDQEVPTQVTTPTGHFKVLKNLPGQRIGAKAWFDHLTGWMSERGFQFCPENPCLGRSPSMCVLIHVDDIMFVGEKEYVQKDFIPSTRKCFEISEQHIEKEHL